MGAKNYFQFFALVIKRNSFFGSLSGLLVGLLEGWSFCLSKRIPESSYEFIDCSAIIEKWRSREPEAELNVTQRKWMGTEWLEPCSVQILHICAVHCRCSYKECTLFCLYVFSICSGWELEVHTVIQFIM